MCCIYYSSIIFKTFIRRKLLKISVWAWQTNATMHVLYYHVWYVLHPFIDYSQDVHTSKGTKDLRLSLANRRNHVRTVLLGMICAVTFHWLFAERPYSYIERYERSPFTAYPLSPWEMYDEYIIVLRKVNARAFVGILLLLLLLLVAAACHRASATPGCSSYK